MSDAADLRAWRAQSALNREVASVPDEVKTEYLELLAAGAILMLQELAGDEHTIGFLQGAMARVSPQQGEQQG